MKSVWRMTAGLLLAAFVAMSVSAAPPYPSRLITFVVPGAPGSGTDIIGRALVEAAQPFLPVRSVVINKPGASGTIGFAEVVGAKPDGSTIGMFGVAMATVQPHLSRLPYNTPADYTPIMRVVNLPIVMFVRSDAPWKTARDVLSFAQANPGKFRVGHGGVATILHLNLEELKILTRVDMPIVSFTSPGQVAAVLGGHIEGGVSHPSLIVPHVEAGKLRVVGVFEPKRLSIFPDAPTFKELGYDVSRGVFYFLVAPKNTPKTLVITLRDAFRRALEAPPFVRMSREQGFEISFQDAGALTRELWLLYEQHGRLIEYLGMKK